MLSLNVIFYIFMVLFIGIGALRGMARELVAASGLILSLFIIKTFAPSFMNVVGLADPTAIGVDPLQMYRRQFYVLTFVHITIAFISFQGPAVTRFAGTKLRRGDNVQNKLLGAIMGAINGWLVVGTIYSFLEFRIQRIPIQDDALGFVRLGVGEQYPFSAEIITRPADALTNILYQYLPIGVFNGSNFFLPFVLVILFVVILIAII